MARCYVSTTNELFDTGTSSTNKNYVMVELGNDDFSSTSNIYNDLWHAYYIRSQDSASAIEIKNFRGPNDSSSVVEKSVNYDYTTNDIFQIMVKGDTIKFIRNNIIDRNRYHLIWLTHCI